MTGDKKGSSDIVESEILIYRTEDGHTKIDVKLEDETVWLTQAQLSELYQTSKSNISEHIKHIFEEGELDKQSVVRKFRTTAADGKNYNTIHYNLDMIISLGYRVKSKIATNFRRWATERLKWCKTNYIMLHMDTPQRRSYMNVRMQISHLWD